MFDIIFKKEINSVKKAAEQCKTRYFWYIDEGVEYSKFDFSFIPNPWESHHIHIFCSKHQRDGGIRLINKRHSESTEYHFHTLPIVSRLIDMSLWTLEPYYNYDKADFTWHPAAEQSNYKHIFSSKSQSTIQTSYYCGYEDDPQIHYNSSDLRITHKNVPIVFIDMENSNSDKRYDDSSMSGKCLFLGNYLDTLKQVVNVDNDYCWVISSDYDYSNFDFDWRPLSWQSDMLHVFPSQDNKFGDTFYINCKHALKQFETIKLLELYDKINFCNDQSVYSTSVVSRKPWPEISYKGDLGKAITSCNFKSDYVLFNNLNLKKQLTLLEKRQLPQPLPAPLWGQKECLLHTYSKNGGLALVPAVAKQVINDQAYDYHKILYHQTHNYIEKPQDVVFISYNEINALENYNVLKRHIKKTPLRTRLHHTSNVKGIANALRASDRALEGTTSDYFYAVFPRLTVHEDFDFSFQPDRLSKGKNYIFYAYNPIIDYAYGHGSIVLYDRDWVANMINENLNIDITTSHDVEVIQIISCTNNVYTPIQAWKTALRETYKLAGQTTVESELRLHKWLTTGLTDLGEYSIAGAEQGITYFKQGTIDKNQINDWDWLHGQFHQVFGQQTSQ